MRLLVYLLGTTQLIWILSFPVLAQEIADQDEPDPVKVKIVFRNTTDEPVTFRFVDVSDEDESKIQYLPVHSDEPLRPGAERTYDSMSGLSWEVAQNGKPFTQYTGDERPRQIVDIKELASWQRPVKINIQNNTDAAIDIFWTDSDGEQELIHEDLPAGMQLMADPIECLPSAVLTLKQNGEFFADYFPGNEPNQVVNLKELKTWYEPVELLFVNKLDRDLHIFFVQLDGKEICYTRDQDGQLDPLQASKVMIQPASPYQRWVIKHDENVVAEYLVTNQKRQIVKITPELLEAGE